MSAPSDFPLWPPGLSRRILLQPGEGWIGAALEDDMHSFRLGLDHAEGRVTAVTGKALRHPWSACPGAVGYIVAELTGKCLDEVARLDARQNCTHLLDLAILSAAHAQDAAPRRFDMQVADRAEGRTTATLAENGVERLRWQLDGLDIVGPEEYAGRTLRELSRWKCHLDPQAAEHAALLRRAVFVSGGRQYVPPPGNHAADQGPSRLGVCYNYQLPQAAESTRTPDWRKDFSQSGHEPLEGFDPSRAFAALKEDT